MYIHMCMYVERNRGDSSCVTSHAMVGGGDNCELVAL